MNSGFNFVSNMGLVTIDDDLLFQEGPPKQVLFNHKYLPDGDVFFLKDPLWSGETELSAAKYARKHNVNILKTVRIIRKNSEKEDDSDE